MLTDRINLRQQHIHNVRKSVGPELLQQSQIEIEKLVDKITNDDNNNEFSNSYLSYWFVKIITTYTFGEIKAVFYETLYKLINRVIQKKFFGYTLKLCMTHTTIENEMEILIDVTLTLI